MIEINYFGTLHVLKAALPSMAARGSGYVVNISSLGGVLGVYGYSAYGPSKFAIRGLSDILRGELAEHGIGISVVFPPDTQTPQLEYETPFKPPVLVELDKSNKVLSAEAVANAILNGVARGRYVITPGFDSTLYFALTNFFGLVYPVMDMMVALARRTIRRAQGSVAAKDHGDQEHIADPDKV
jgi:3-dehydrosphinganine reductase